MNLQIKRLFLYKISKTSDLIKNIYIKAKKYACHTKSELKSTIIKIVDTRINRLQSGFSNNSYGLPPNIDWTAKIR